MGGLRRGEIGGLRGGGIGGFKDGWGLPDSHMSDERPLEVRDE